MRKSGKKVVVAILLVTLLSQTLYSAAASMFGLGTRSYAYADDEMADDVEPGAEVDASTQDDAGIVQSAPESEASGEETDPGDEGSANYTGDGEADSTGEDPAEPVQNENPEGTSENDFADSEEESVNAIRLRVSYVDERTGSEIRDTEDLSIENDFLYVLKDNAPEIQDHTYSKTTINIENEEYDITALCTEEVKGTTVYSITTDRDPSWDSRWTRLVKDTVIVMDYSEGEAVEENKGEADTEADAENETVSANETVSGNETETEGTKRIYEFEDGKIKVTATLERTDAVPDDAYFAVTPLTETAAEQYLRALNENKREDEPSATAENTLLYDIGFYTDESKSEEIEPEEGSVKITFEFKKDQLSEELKAKEQPVQSVSGCGK